MNKKQNNNVTDINIIKDIAYSMNLLDLVSINSYPDLDAKTINYQSNEFKSRHLRLYSNDKLVQCNIIHCIINNMMVMHIFYYGASEYNLMDWFSDLMKYQKIFNIQTRCAHLLYQIIDDTLIYVYQIWSLHKLNVELHLFGHSLGGIQVTNCGYIFQCLINDHNNTAMKICKK